MSGFFRSPDFASRRVVLFETSVLALFFLLHHVLLMSAAIKGRGAKSNATGRYEVGVREAFDDGWTADDADIQPLRTTLSPEHARTLISRNTSPDIGFDRSINPYKGCEHGWPYYSVTHP